MEADLSKFQAIAEEIAGLLVVVRPAAAAAKAASGGPEAPKGDERTYVPEPVHSDDGSCCRGEGSSRKRKAMEAYMESEDRAGAFFVEGPPAPEEVVRKSHLVDALAAVWRAIVLRPSDRGCEEARRSIEGCLVEP